MEENIQSNPKNVSWSSERKQDMLILNHMIHIFVNWKIMFLHIFDISPNVPKKNISSLRFYIRFPMYILQLYIYLTVIYNNGECGFEVNWGVVLGLCEGTFEKANKVQTMRIVVHGELACASMRSANIYIYIFHSIYNTNI